MFSKILVGLLAVVVVRAQPTITWTQTSTAGGSGWTKIVGDPTTGGAIILKNNGGSSIFSTNTFSVNAAGNTLTNIVGTNQLADTCPADIPYSSNGGTFTGSLPNRPGDRHPVGQQTYDSNRRVFWRWGGIINDCADYTVTVSGTTGTITSASPIPTDGSWNGMRVYIAGSANCPTSATPCTITSVNSGAGTVTFASAPGNVSSASMLWLDQGNGGSGTRIDMFYMSLNATPTSDLYSRVFPAAFPTTISGGSYGYQGNMEYDPYDDILFDAEIAKAWQYCSTIPFSGGSPTGVLSSTQVAAGCTSADNWTVEPNASPGYVYPGMRFDPVRQVYWYYVGSNGTPVLYAYNPSSVATRNGISPQSWKQFCLSCTMPSEEQQSSFGGSEWNALAWDSIDNLLIYHYGVNTSGVGAPADYAYNPISDIMTLLSTSGGGPTGFNGSAYNGTSIDYLSGTNALISYDVGGVWVGQLSSPTYSTTLTIQEALFAGDLTGTTMASNVIVPGGIQRTNEPWCMGVPIADATGITSLANFSLSGMSAGQFRLLGTWPDGNYKWIKACGILSGLAAGTQATTTISNGGSTNTSVGALSLPNPQGGTPVSDTTGYGYGGSNMASLTSGTITVNTGAATFTIKAAGNYNVIDTAVVGGTTILATSSSATRGLVLTGPAFNATTAITGTVVGPYTITTGTNDTLQLAAQSANPVFVTLAAGSGVTATTIAGEINAVPVSGLTASAVGGAVVLTSTTTGTGGNIQIYSGNANSTLGFVNAAYSGAMTCSPDPSGTTCATVYSSANDSSGTCVIEENGPVMATIQCQGVLADSSGDVYMQYTTRQYFYAGKSNEKITVTLRNANYNTEASPSVDCHYNSGTTQCNGGSFDTAAKGIRSLEIRLGLNSQIVNYDIGTDTSPQTGTLTGSGDFAYIYQGQSNWMLPTAAPDTEYCQPGTSYCANLYTTDTGYIAKHGATTIASGNETVTPQGWTDCTDSSSNGLSVGIDEFATMWPVSLECYYTGSELRIGLFSQYNAKNVYMPWPQWKIWETYLTFHAGALASPSAEFLKQQHFLLTRPSIAYLNSTAVWLYPMISGTTEDAYYVNLFTTANPATLPLSNFCFGGFTTNCTPDRGTSNNENQQGKGIGLGNYRYYAWSQGGSLNQEEFRWFDFGYKFIQRGYTGRFLNSRYFYRYLNELHWAHADATTSGGNTINGFTWRSRPYPEVNNGNLAYQLNELPTQQVNQNVMFGWAVSLSPQWEDYLHEHSYGEAEYYFNTGDESMKEASIPLKDYYLNTNTSTYGLSPVNTTGITRAYGVWLLGTAFWSLYYNSIGDSTDATSFQTAGVHQFTNYVNVQSCEGGIRPGQSVATFYPLGCPLADAGNASVGSGNAYGTVTASGTTVTFVSGVNFDPGVVASPATVPYWIPGSTIIINSNPYILSHVSSSTSLTVTTAVTGCSSPCSYSYGGGVGGGATAGISYERGTHQANSAGGGYCAWNDGTDSGMIGGNYRIEQTFQQAILIDGLLNFRRAMGTGWTYYDRAADLAYGMALNNTTENFNYNGNPTQFTDGSGFYNGFAYFRVIDYPVVCPVGTTNADSALIPGGGRLYDVTGLPNGDQNLYATFVGMTDTVGDTSWYSKFNIGMWFGSQAVSAWLGDWGMPLVSTSIYNMNNPPATSLQSIAFTCNNCSGATTNYSLTFTAPSGTCTNNPGCLRVKWAPRTITAINALLGFDSLNTFTFSVDPATNVPWFGANNAELTGTVPTPTPGTPQTITVVTSTTGLTASNFSVAASFPSSGPVSSPTGVAGPKSVLSPKSVGH